MLPADQDISRTFVGLHHARNARAVISLAECIDPHPKTCGQRLDRVKRPLLFSTCLRGLRHDVTDVVLGFSAEDAREALSAMEPLNAESVAGGRLFAVTD